MVIYYFTVCELRMPLAKTIKCHLVRNKSLRYCYYRDIYYRSASKAKKTKKIPFGLLSFFAIFKKCDKLLKFSDFCPSSSILHYISYSTDAVLFLLFDKKTFFRQKSRTHFVKENKGCFDSHPFCLLRNCSFPGKWKGCHAFMKVFESQNISFLFSSLVFP